MHQVWYVLFQAHHSRQLWPVKLLRFHLQPRNVLGRELERSLRYLSYHLNLGTCSNRQRSLGSSLSGLSKLSTSPTSSLSNLPPPHPHIMRFSIASSLLLLAGAAQAASSWGFADGSVSIGVRKSSSASTQKISATQYAKESVVLGHKDTLTVSLTTKEGSKAKRPHQAFLILTESSGLEAPFPLNVKPSGKGSVEITQKDLPVQLLLSDVPLKASLVLGSFGSTTATITPVFDVEIQLDPHSPAPRYQFPLRYSKLALIDHIFRPDPKSPPMVVSLVFVLAVLATIPALFGGWLLLGANVNHLPKALGSAPVSHIVFFGSIVAMEGAFFLYYSSWNLFQILPVIGVLSVVAFLSGNKALSEVQGRRLAGER
ncbi:Oligosaccharyltransferase subunit Ribophorin II-domain-containing protein [Mariannaea sp. PMI_226]|nr:Oligosaccharyltransferase subunit Ribophorin II-domain-containing protein [Mariannaea sp. PMI_226]